MGRKQERGRIDRRRWPGRSGVGVEFVVGGGVACLLHGVERVTMDVDLAVLMQAENFGRFVNVMIQLGLKPRIPISPDLLLDPAITRMMVEEKQALVFTFVNPDQPFKQVDLFLRNDMSYASLLPDSEWMELRGFRLRVVNRHRLLTIKLSIQPPRAKDAIDIEWLRRNQI